MEQTRPQSLQREHGPSDTLILNFQPPEQKKNKFRLLQSAKFEVLFNGSPRKPTPSKSPQFSFWLQVSSIYSLLEPNPVFILFDFPQFVLLTYSCCCPSPSASTTSLVVGSPPASFSAPFMVSYSHSHLLNSGIPGTTPASLLTLFRPCCDLPQTPALPPLT